MTLPMGMLDRTPLLPQLFPKPPVPAQQDVTQVQKPLPPLSPVLQATKEMLANGITEDQRQAYMPRISEALAYHVDPNGYQGHVEDIKSALLHAVSPLPIPESNKHFGKAGIENGIGSATIQRLDAWRMYLGLPQNNGTFGISSFQPSKGTDNKVYYKINNFVNLLSKSPTVTADPKQTLPVLIRDVKSWKDGTGMSRPERDDWAGVMGEFRFSLGKDERGNYLAYYDKWDLDPSNPNSKLPAFGGRPLSSKIANAEQEVAATAAKHIGKPFEIYDRIYYDPKTLKAIPETKLKSVGNDQLTKLLGDTNGASGK